MKQIVQPWNLEWPEVELENLTACPVCNGAERRVFYHELVDNVFLCAPGKWTLWRCSSCGSAYLDPRPSPASIHRAYENYYTHEEPANKKADYAKLSAPRKLRRRFVNGYTNWRYSTREYPASSLGVIILWVVWPMKSRLDSEYRHLPRLPSAGGRVLDIGCGNGDFLRIARICGWSAVGIDPDPRAVATASKQGFHVREGGVEQFDGVTELFDVITMSHVIEHVHDPVAVLAACHRLLRPGGRLWLETPNIDSLGRRRFGRDWRGLEPPRHLLLFNRRSLVLALSRAGFASIEDMSRTSALIGMTKASEALRQGRSIDDEIRLGRATEWRLRADRLRLVMVPDRKEFLTVIAHKQ